MDTDKAKGNIQVAEMSNPRLVLLVEIAKLREMLTSQSTECGIGLTDHREDFMMIWSCLKNVPRKERELCMGRPRKRWLDEVMKTVQPGTSERYVPGLELRMAKFYPPTFN